MVLFEQYIQLFESPDEWRYYTDMSYDTFPLEYEDRAVDFIHSCFRAGEKESVFDHTINEDILRHVHSVSVFFLGLLLKPLFNLPEYKPDFRYLWFLACLYHDYGYFIEKDKKNYPPGLFSLTRLLKTFSIAKYNLLNTKLDAHLNRCLIEKYYLYCRKERQFINHSIVGGLLIYDRFKKNFEETRSKALQLNPDIDQNDFCFKGLHWSSDHDEYYKRVAISIIAHNIWYASDIETKESYRQFGLDALIIENEKPFSRESDPFLLLLVLADTLEPIKMFSQWNYKCILKKIEVKIEQSAIEITVLDDCVDYKGWFNKIVDLQAWIRISVKHQGNKLVLNLL